MRFLLGLLLVATLVATSQADNRLRVLSSTGGTGSTPEVSDEVEYRFSVWQTRGTRDPANRRDGKGFMSEIAQSFQGDQLLTMRAGEKRRLRYVGSIGELLGECDHLGCDPPDSWELEIELVSVTPHHDDLPDGMHIGFRPLHVRRGTVRAPLTAREIDFVGQVRLRGDSVEIEVAGNPSSRRRKDGDSKLAFTLDQLRARLADAEATTAIARRRWAAAQASAEHALQLDPSLDSPHLWRAWALLAQNKLGDAAAALAPVIQRNPVWLYWRLVSTPALARLVSHPAITRLVAEKPGTFELVAGTLSVQTEPTGRFLAYRTSFRPPDGKPWTCGVINVVDRATLAVAIEIPVSTCEDPSGGAERRAAERTLRALGFTAASSELAALSPAAQRTRSFPDQKAEFVRAGLTLVALGQAADRGHTPIDPPPHTRLTEAQLIGDVVVYGWDGSDPGCGVALRSPSAASPPAAATPAPPAPR